MNATSDTMSSDHPLPPLFLPVMVGLILGLVLGTSFYLYLSILRPDVLFTLPVLAYFLVYGFRGKKTLAFYAGLFWLVFLLLLMAVHTVFFHNQIQILDFLYHLNLISLYLLAGFIANHPKANYWFCRLYFFVFFLLAFVLVMQFLFDIEFMHQITDVGLEGIFPSAFFHNPNNLAAICIVSLPLLHWLAQENQLHQQFRWVFLLMVVMLMAMMSRTALALLVLYPFLQRALFLDNPLRLLFPLTGFLLLFLFIQSEAFEALLIECQTWSNPFIARSSERLWIALFALDEDNSVSYRQTIYDYAFPKIFSIMPGLGARNYGEFFMGGVSGLAYYNPHSFLIELPLAYSSLALVAFLGLIACMVYKAFRHLSQPVCRFLLLACFFFITASFIPSTIFRLQWMWLPMFVLYLTIGRQPLRYRLDKVQGKSPCIA